jgi:transposase
MTKKNNALAKKEILKKQGILNPNPEKVKDVLFENHEFFDSNDLIQVKYEMIRQVLKDGLPITKASSNFGYSRFSFYRILSAFKKEGILGLIPQKRGPMDAHKLSEKVMDFVEAEMKKDKTARAGKLKTLIKNRFDITIHTRSIQRAVARRKKAVKQLNKLNLEKRNFSVYSDSDSDSDSDADEDPDPDADADADNYMDNLILPYETLRSHVLENLGFNRNPDMGYVLFLGRGMLTWMENCCTPLLEPGEPLESEDQNTLTLKNNNSNCCELPDSVKKQIVFALTNIVISHQRRLYEGK